MLFTLYYTIRLSFRCVWMGIEYGCHLSHLSHRDMFASFGKLDEDVMSYGDGHTCHVEGIWTVHVKLYDGTIRELKDVRYVPCMTKNMISVGALEAEGLRGTLEEGVLKMSSDLLVVLKEIRCDNLYYLKGSAMIENLVSSEWLNGAQWNLRRVGQICLDSLQAVAKQGVEKSAMTCKWNSYEHSVLDQKTKVMFDTAVHQSKGLLDVVHMDIWGPIKRASLGDHRYFVLFINSFSWCTP